MNIVFIGCVQFSLAMIQQILPLPDVRVVGIVSKSSSSINSDFYSLEPVAEAHGIPCFRFDKASEPELVPWLQALAPDVIYCMGWSHLLPASVLNLPQFGVIGYHPAALPRNRGRHPIIWALALGLNETASTFFIMEEGADSGDIISQEHVAISDADDAASLYEKLQQVAQRQIVQFTEALVHGCLQRTPQNHQDANVWRKRSKADGVIDWRMSARQIHNLVRALTRPYVGAHCVYQSEEIKIWRTLLVTDEVNAELDVADVAHLEPGKIIRADESTFTVKCGEGLLRVVEHDFRQVPKEGSYL